MLDPAPTFDLLRNPCPVRAITLSLPLATIEELDQLASSRRISRQELLRQTLTVALMHRAPHLPDGPDPLGELAERAYHTHVRSLELAWEREA